jgi:hypothetical protein
MSKSTLFLSSLTSSFEFDFDFQFSSSGRPCSSISRARLGGGCESKKEVFGRMTMSKLMRTEIDTGQGIG